MREKGYREKNNASFQIASENNYAEDSFLQLNFLLFVMSHYIQDNIIIYSYFHLTFHRLIRIIKE